MCGLINLSFKNLIHPPLSLHNVYFTYIISNNLQKHFNQFKLIHFNQELIFVTYFCAILGVIMASGNKSKSKQLAKKRKEPYEHILEFITTHFSNLTLWKRYYNHFMIRLVIQSYFVNLDNLNNLSIFSKTLRTLLMDWGNVLVLRELVYTNIANRIVSY